MSARPKSEIPALALSREHAAASLDIEGKTFDRWVRPHLKSVFIGGKELWPVDELARFVARAQRVLPSSPSTTKRRGAAGTAPGMAQEESAS